MAKSPSQDLPGQLSIAASEAHGEGAQLAAQRSGAASEAHSEAAHLQQERADAVPPGVDAAKPGALTKRARGHKTAAQPAQGWNKFGHVAPSTKPAVHLHGYSKAEQERKQKWHDERQCGSLPSAYALTRRHAAHIDHAGRRRAGPSTSATCACKPSAPKRRQQRGARRSTPRLRSGARRRRSAWWRSGASSLRRRKTGSSARRRTSSCSSACNSTRAEPLSALQRA